MAQVREPDFDFKAFYEKILNFIGPDKIIFAKVFRRQSSNLHYRIAPSKGGFLVFLRKRLKVHAYILVDLMFELKMKSNCLK